MAYKRLLLALLAQLMILSSANMASANNNFPRGCKAEGMIFEDKKLLLTPLGGKQSVYMINNKLKSPLKVTYFDPKHPNLGTWSNIVKSRSWSSFAADMDIIFNCQTINDKKLPETVDCFEALNVCQYLRAKIPLHMHGSYFVIENQYTMNMAVRDTIREGILLR